MYNPESLCFILSQNDNADFKPHAHLAANPELKLACAAETKEQIDNNSSIKGLREERKGVKREYRASKKQVEELEKEIKELKRKALKAPTETARGRKRASNGAFGTYSSD
jgi:septal ring factor EnvC (AmiA/AmiB activator)